MPLSRWRLRRSVLQALQPVSPEFVQYLSTFPHRPLGEKILLIESAEPEFVEATRTLLQKLIPSRAEVTRIFESSFPTTWLRLRKQDFDSAIVFLTGAKGRAGLKLLPFLLGLPKILVVNENGSYFYADARSLGRFLVERLLYAPAPEAPVRKILWIQTEDSDFTVRAIEKILQPPLFPRAELLLVCREDDRKALENCPRISSVVSYKTGGREDILRIRKEIRRFDADLAAAAFTGRPVFRKQKLFFLSAPVRRKLVFNAQFDCYPLTIQTSPRLFRHHTGSTLLIQTEADELTVKAAEILRQPHVTTSKEILVFCRDDKRTLFEKLPGVRQVITYRPGHVWGNSKAVLKVLRTRVNVVAALFTDKPIFRFHKILFLLAPARGRLVFNQNLDCFYLTRETLPQLLPGSQLSEVSPFRLILRLALKPVLFLPRFLYLVIWVTFIQLRRSYYLSQRK